MPDTAIQNIKRDLAQHQTVVTDIQTVLMDPEVSNFKWLDLCCGKGQILANLDSHIEKSQCKKIHFFAYDSNESSIGVTKEIASKYNFGSINTKIAEVKDFCRHRDEYTKCDYITFINSIHEINPFQVMDVINECVLSLSEDGKIYIFDMENINPPELGAIPFFKTEIDRIIDYYFSIIKADSKPQTSLWKYTNTNAWQLIIRRKFLRISNEDIIERYLQKRDELNGLIRSIIEEKKTLIATALDSMYEIGEKITSEDKDEERMSVYLYWAIKKCLGE